MGDFADDAIERGMWEEEHADEYEESYESYSLPMKNTYRNSFTSFATDHEIEALDREALVDEYCEEPGTIGKQSDCVAPFKSKVQQTEPMCPECGRKMVLRTNKGNGSNFYGCSLFPKCKKTLPYTGHKIVQEKTPTQIARDNSDAFTKFISANNYEEFEKGFFDCFCIDDANLIGQHIHDLYVILNKEKQEEIPF